MEIQEVYQLFHSRRQKFAEHLRTKGIEPDEATLLRHSAYLLSDVALGLSADYNSPLPEVNESKACATFTITTYDADRYGDEVLPKGCIPHLKNYRRNPRVFFAHKQKDLPIGSARTPGGELDLQFFDDKVKSTCHFHCETAESEVVFRLVARKELQTASIGFLPIRAAIFSPEKTPNRPETDDKGDEIIYFKEDPYFRPLRFHEWELLEWSVVPIPANQECIAEHLSRGEVEGEKITPVLRKAMEPYAAKKKVMMGYTPPAIEQDPEPVELQYQYSIDHTKNCLVKDGTPFITLELLDHLNKCLKEGGIFKFENEKISKVKKYKDLTDEEKMSIDSEESALLLEGYVKLVRKGTINVEWKKLEDLVKEFVENKSQDDIVLDYDTMVELLLGRTINLGDVHKTHIKVWDKNETKGWILKENHESVVLEDPEKDWPLGAKFLSRSMKIYGETCEWMNSMGKLLDQPRVKKLAAKKMNRLHKLSAAALKLGAQLYPDKFSYTPSEEENQKSAKKETEKKNQELKEEEMKLLREELEKAVKKQIELSKVIFQLTGRKV